MPEDPKLPWDGLRAAFYLVATILLLQTIAIIGASAWCFYVGRELLSHGPIECTKEGRLTELLASAVTTALAFAMAFINKKEPPK